jgi:hypothetical protein
MRVNLGGGSVNLRNFTASCVAALAAAACSDWFDDGIESGEANGAATLLDGAPVGARGNGGNTGGRVDPPAGDEDAGTLDGEAPPSKLTTVKSGRTCADWGTCTNADPCLQTGTQERSCTEQACARGKCVEVTVTEKKECTRGTDGSSCGARTCDGYGECDFGGSACAESGSMSQTCYDYVCGGGTCNPVPTTETAPCSRSTEGTRCQDTDGCWSDGVCVQNGCSGTITTVCNVHECYGGGCLSYPVPSYESCTPGAVCAPGDAVYCEISSTLCPVDCSEFFGCYYPAQQTCASDCSGYGECLRTTNALVCRTGSPW